MDSQHTSRLTYTTDDNCIWIECSCEWGRCLGVNPSLEDVEQAWSMHLMVERSSLGTSGQADGEGEACGAGWDDAPEPYRVHHDTGTCSCVVFRGHGGLHRCSCGGERGQEDSDVFPAPVSSGEAESGEAACSTCGGSGFVPEADDPDYPEAGVHQTHCPDCPAPVSSGGQADGEGWGAVADAILGADLSYTALAARPVPSGHEVLVENDDEWERKCGDVDDGSLLLADGHSWIAFSTENGDWYAIRPLSEDDEPTEGCAATPTPMETIPYPWEFHSPTPVAPERAGRADEH